MESLDWPSSDAGFGRICALDHFDGGACTHHNWQPAHQSHLMDFSWPVVTGSAASSSPTFISCLAGYTNTIPSQEIDCKCARLVHIWYILAKWLPLIASPYAPRRGPSSWAWHIARCLLSALIFFEPAGQATGDVRLRLWGSLIEFIISTEREREKMSSLSCRWANLVTQTRLTMKPDRQTGHSGTTSNIPAYVAVGPKEHSR